VSFQVRLNRVQRGILIATALVIGVIQLVSIADNGLDENRGWVWALLAASGLLVAALASSSPPEGKATADARAPRPAKGRSPSDQQLAEFNAHMAAAGRVLVESERIGARLYDFVTANDLSHQAGALAWILSPRISSMLAAHAVVTTAVDDAGVRVEPLTWETYRTTLAHRLARQRQELFRELMPGAAAATGDARPDQAYIDLATGEIKLWEDVARRSPIPGPPHRGHAGLLTHVAATFGGRSAPQDDARFERILAECYAEATQRVVPLLTPATGSRVS
jgi:hypothetical protein